MIPNIPVLRPVIAALSAMAIAGCASNDKLPPAPGSISGTTQQPGGTNPYGTANPHRKVGNPYKIAGIWYYPEEDPDYDNTGIASWYGPKFHGRKTANGEIFDMNRLTAAHPTLPLPSVVRVTNLENGRTIDLRVNDRGPFAHGRIIDLSRAAAEQLGFRAEGLANVRVQYLSEAGLNDAILALGEPEAFANGRLARVTHAAADKAHPQYDTVRTRIATGPEITVTRPLARSEDLDAQLISDARTAVAKAELMVVETAVPAQNLTDVSTISPPVAQGRPAPTVRASQNQQVKQGTWLVQVAAFSSKENATRTIARFDEATPARSLRTENPAGGWLYKVRLGPYQTEAEARQARELAIGKGFSDARIVQF